MKAEALTPTLTQLEAERIVRSNPALLARINRDTKDKSYQLYPLGQEAAEYLRVKRKRLTPRSYQDYESCLDKFVRHFTDLELEDFEPPIGTQRLEEFLNEKWGDREPRTYNKNLSYLTDFFKHFRLRGRLHGDPTLAIERAKARGVHRETFPDDLRRAIIAEQDDRRDTLGLRLLLDYGLRKGSLKAIQFKHFDHVRKRLTVFSKGGKVRNLPIPDAAFWHDLERLILDSTAEPHHFLIQSTKGNQYSRTRIPDKPKSDHGMHDWWYGCLVKAGIVSEGVTSGERMHKARHTAGQRVLDHSGNLKAVQMLLGHESIQTTGDQYVDWDDLRLAQTMAKVLEES